MEATSSPGRARPRRCVPRARLLLGCAALSALLLAGCRAERAPSGAPNVLFLILDDVGYADLDPYGDDFYATPNLDRLASEGMRFTRYYTFSACRPTRMSILTGLYPTAFRGAGIPDRVVTLAEVLRGAGYATAHVGKWHLGRARPEYQPGGQGFDRAVVTSSADHRDPQLVIDGSGPQTVAGHTSEILTDHAIRWIEQNADRPFFLQLSYFAPHKPWRRRDAPRDWLARYPQDDPRQVYGALLSHTDAEIGRLLEALEALGLAERTLLVVSGDNGGIPSVSSNGGLRGGKLEVFEGGIRAPLLVRWPEAVAAGSVNDSFVLSIDWLPTLARVAGVDPAGLGDGEDVSASFLEGHLLARSSRLFFWDVGHGVDWFAVRRGDWKLVSDARGRRLLFDLGSDPREQHDRAREHPQRVQELLAEHRAWRRRSGAISVAVAEARGDARVAGSLYEFGGGSLRLLEDPRFGEEALSFQAKVTPATDAGERTLATCVGGWRLLLRPTGRLELRPRAGAQAEEESLVGRRALAAGSTYDVAFARQPADEASGWRLYVDGVLEAEGHAAPAGADGSGCSQVLLGNDADGGTPFVGTMQSVGLYAVPLTGVEVMLGV